MKKILLSTVLIAGALLFARTVPAQELGDKRVMVVHSYHETQKGHVVEMTQGITQAFMGSGVKMNFFHMDTKRNPEPAWKIRSGKMAMAAMADFAPHVVIAMDDNAQAFFVKEVMDQENAPDFVFGGVNAEPGVYGYPRKNLTGVLERPNIRESIDLLLKIQPHVKSLLMIMDKSRTTDLFVTYCKSLDLPVEIIGYIQPQTLDEWETAIDRYKDRVDAFGVYVIRTIRESRSSEVMLSEMRLMEILNKEAGLPTVGFFDTAAQAGVLCGISVSMKEQGYQAGHIARQILMGRKPEAFPMAPTRQGRIQLNLKQAERLGIDLDWDMISRADVVVK